MKSMVWKKERKKKRKKERIIQMRGRKNYKENMAWRKKNNEL